MDINSLQGAAAYTNPHTARPPVDNSQVPAQDLEASRTDPNTEPSTAAQNAFEVTITPKAQDRLSAEPAQEPTENQGNQNITPNRETNQIINIVA